ncbi:MAG: rod shape-determining protein MreD [Firmicutes bacterium]|nr:rod shape-determining protein MreD [Bacillota bacterium]
MRPVLGAVALVAAAGVLQLGVAPRMAVLGVKPDFLLLTVIGLALCRGTVAGGLAGAGAGLLEDIVVGQFLGVRAAAFALVGLGVARARTRLFGDQPLVPVAAALGGAALAEMASWALWRAAGLPLPLGQGLIRVVLPACLYNGLLAPLFPGWWVRRVQARAGVNSGA